MIYCLCMNHATLSVAYNLLGYHAQTDTPRIRAPLMTALALFTREWAQESLLLIRKYACVKVFSFILNYYQHQSYHTQTKLQLKFMNQQNKVIENIVNKIISQSRKNSIESIECKPISQKSQQSNHSQCDDQEYIIKKSDLKSFVQKMALQNYQNNIRLQDKQLQFMQLQKEVHRSISQIEHLKQALENRDIVFKKKMEEMEGKYTKQKRKRQQMELELNWSTNKIKDQLREIQKLKQSFIAKVQHKPQNQNAAISQSENKVKKQYTTPGKDITTKKLQHLASKNCQSIQYSIIHSDTANYRPQTNVKEYKTQSKTEDIHIFNQIQNIQVKSKESLNTNVQMSRFHRHAEIDQKDRIIKQLAQKSIYLQSYIQKLTKKYIGEFVYSEDIQKKEEKKQGNNFRQQLKTIEQPSMSSLERTESEVQLSGAFKLQSQL